MKGGIFPNLNFKDLLVMNFLQNLFLQNYPILKMLEFMWQARGQGRFKQIEANLNIFDNTRIGSLKIQHSIYACEPVWS